MSTRTSGWVIVWASLVGAACAVVIIGWPAEVARDRYSYPFGPTSYVVSQVLFATRDLVTLAVLTPAAGAL